MISPAAALSRLPGLWRAADDKLSLAMLVLVNLIPLGGVLFAGWEVGFILLVYWAENLVLGGYNILKMALARGGTGRWDPKCVGFIPFFTVHYGLFCLVHGVFVVVLSGGRGGPFRGNPLEALLENLDDVALALLALVISHGCSFVQNYWLKGEYRTRTVESLMIAPYGRIVILHVVILFGGFVTMLFQSALPLLLLLILIKITIDLVLHSMSHRKGVLPALFDTSRK